MEPTEPAIKANTQFHIEWIFREELPSFLAVVDKKKFTLSFYSLISVWFIYYECGSICGKLTLRPRLDPSNTADVGRPLDKGEMKEWPGMREYDVDLGHPVATVSLDTLKSPAKIQAVKEKLRIAIHFAQLNRVHEKLQIPYFYWFAKTTPDSSSLHPAFYILPVPPTARQIVLTELAPSLISLSLLYKQTAEKEKLAAIQTLLNELPLSVFTTPVQQVLPEILPTPPKT